MVFLRKLTLLVMCFCILYLSLFSSANAQDDNDWQFWKAVSVEKKVTGILKFVVEEETRWSDNMNRFMYQAVDTGLVYAPFAWFDLGGNFRYLVQDDAGQWEHEARPHLNAVLKHQWNNLRVLNRSRLEYRYLTRTKDTWRYRNMSEIKFTSDWSLLKISPYLREETFFKFDQDNYNQNRLSGGFQFELFKHAEIDLFYLWQSLKSVGKWRDVNVLGTNIKFTF